MSFDNQVTTSFYLTQEITNLISVNNHIGLKIFCIRGIESLKQGAFNVTGASITRLATAQAMLLWSQELISQQ
jgi:hypothetical protein